MLYVFRSVSKMFLIAGIVVSLFLVTITFLYLKWCYKVRKYQYIPTPRYLLPIFGHSLRIPKDITKIFDFHAEIFEETKSKIRVLWLSFLPFVSIYDVDMIESLLKSNSLLRKGANYSLANDVLGSGILRSDGEKWKSRRRLLTPAFHFGILRSNASVINHHAQCLVDFLKKKIIVDTNIDMQEILKPISLSILCETAMGVRCNLYESTNKLSAEVNYCNAIKEILHLHTSRIYKPWLHNKYVYKYLSRDGEKFHKAVHAARSFVLSVIESRIKLLENSTSESSIFVDILLQAYKKNEIDINGILEEVNTFMFAGHDTVSSALSWTLYALGKDERIQNKLYDEIKKSNCDHLNKDAISELKYLDCVAKESLRLYPPAPMISRFFHKETVLAGKKIPSGSTVALHFYQLHRDSSLWKNPSEFTPERFLNYDSEKKNPYAFVPFSAGPRNCIGQKFAMLELKIVLFHLVKNFHFESLHEEKNMVVYSSAVLRTKNGIWLKISNR